MKKLIGFIVLSVLLIACSRNAVTGRKQFKLFNEGQIQQMAAAEYRSFLSSNRVVSNNVNKDAAMVRRIGERLQNAVNSFYANNPKVAQELAGYQWEFNLVDDATANAWCMPGGKIVVYTGLLPVTQDEPSLAVVMGHEVAHALAHHGNERMSAGMAQQLGGVALDVLLANKPQETRALFNTAYGLGSNVGYILPFSRKHELEADRYGLIFAALAGYNPQVSIGLWERMAKAGGGQRPPEFLSTHPAEERRIAELQKHMAEALQYYKPVAR
jgi:predicted Zn-dependent protease